MLLNRKRRQIFYLLRKMRTCTAIVMSFWAREFRFEVYSPITAAAASEQVLSGQAKQEQKSCSYSKSQSC